MAPFLNIIVRITLIFGNVLMKHAVQALNDGSVHHWLKQAQSRLRMRMSATEARDILGLPSNSQIQSHSDIIQRANKLYDLNTPNDQFVGSPYLQRKAMIAQQILQETQHQQQSVDSNKNNTHSKSSR